MQVSEHVHALRIPFVIPTERGNVDRFVYAFIIFGAQICLIDSGVASSQELIFDCIEQNGRKPSEISTLILTHSHPDHLGAAGSIREATGCAVVAHAGEKDWIEDVDKQFAERPIPGFHSLVGGSVAVDRTVDEGDTIKLGEDLSLSVLHTPGHSRGSIALHLHSEKVLFSGDAIPTPGDMPIWDDPLVSIESLAKLKNLVGVEILLSSWDEPRTGSAINRVLNQGANHLREVHNAVLEIVKAHPPVETTEMCRRALERLGLPPSYLANPLVIRSLAASRKHSKSPESVAEAGGAAAALLIGTALGDDPRQREFTPEEAKAHLAAILQRSKKRQGQVLPPK